MEFSDYQRMASETSQLPLGGPQSAIAPLLGLASETGQVLNVFKKYLRDGLDPAANREFLKEELGDLLWYVAAVATAVDLKMEDIVAENLRRVHDRYPSQGASQDWSALPILDVGYPERERFPRRLVVAFAERESSGRRAASLTLVSAEPNPFPAGPVTVDGKRFGFKVGGELGASLTDNSRRADDYRYHDAIHLSFMATLGWSPTFRALLRIKRKSNPTVDECEDGARAIYAEEGLAAVLSRLAERRTGFQSENSVDGDAIIVAKAAVTGLEAEKLPSWLWRRAINQGFVAMRLLGENGGGYLVADLNERKLVYFKILP